MHGCKAINFYRTTSTSAMGALPTKARAFDLFLEFIPPQKSRKSQFKRSLTPFSDGISLFPERLQLFKIESESHLAGR